MIVSPVSAHGPGIETETVTGIEVNAKFDDGTPMINAQITVYAPDDPETAWLQGVADEEGYFVFVPDLSIPGRWDISVRTAGHGDIIYVTIDENASVTEIVSASVGMTTTQRILMAVLGIWGLVGTALYFSRNKERVKSD